MTVCIAGVFKLSTMNPAFILCCDRLLGEGEWGSADGATKLFALGYNWMALLAGNWSNARELAEALALEIKQWECPKDKSEFILRIRETAERFGSSILCKPEPCELLITGFVAEYVPVLLHLSLDNGNVEISIQHDLYTIGEGGYAAMLMLKHRAYEPLAMGIEKACYAIYEAKRFSETVSSVGSLTRMMIHHYQPNPGKDDVCWWNFTQTAFDWLDELRGKFSLRPISEIEAFPPNSIAFT